MQYDKLITKHRCIADDLFVGIVNKLAQWAICCGSKCKWPKYLGIGIDISLDDQVAYLPQYQVLKCSGFKVYSYCTVLAIV